MKKSIIVLILLFSCYGLFVLPEKFNPLFLLFFVLILAISIKFWKS